MVNTLTLVGRIVYDPELRTLDSGKAVTTLTLALQRSYKNAETGNYDTDFIRCTLWDGIAENTVQYCQKGSVVGVRGRLSQKTFTYEEDKSFSYPEVVAEKISFIQHKKPIQESV